MEAARKSDIVVSKCESGKDDTEQQPRRVRKRVRRARHVDSEDEDCCSEDKQASLSLAPVGMAALPVSRTIKKGTESGGSQHADEGKTMSFLSTRGIHLRAATKHKAGGVSADSQATVKATLKELDLVELRNNLKSHVKKVAELVDEDWHDGGEEQDEAILEWYADLEAPLNTVYSIARSGSTVKGFEKINKAMLVMADSWKDMQAIPKRCDVRFCIYEDDCEDRRLVIRGGTRIRGPGEVFHWVWRVVLVSACSTASITDDTILRIIKDAHDYGWRLNDPKLAKKLPKDEPHAGITRLKRLFEDQRKEWDGLKSNFKVHYMRQAIDRRFQGSKHRRTRDSGRYNKDDCVVM